MKIAILGYGRMGKEIEQIAIARGHEIVLKVTAENREEALEQLANADAAIEFSQPASAVANIKACFAANVPVVVGTTGWYDDFDEVSNYCKAESKALFTATNFSLGVNLFFELNRQLARLMNPHTDYEVSMEEIHHIHKLDSPSGTAITIADGLIDELERKTAWTEDNPTPTSNEVNIHAKRVGEVPGTHIVHYNSDIDHIEIKHEAHNRKGFALGSVLAAEWLQGKAGVFTMKDLLNLN